MKDRSRSSGRSLLAQALAAQFDAIGVVDDPIEDGVGQGGIADEFVPAIDRKLAGDDQRAGVVAILDDLQQVALLLGQRGSGPQSSRMRRSTRPSWRIS